MSASPPVETPPGRLAPEVRRALIAVLVARTGLSSGIRVVLPFLPVIARGLGTSLEVVASLVAVRSLVALATPAVAPLSERIGRRALMTAGLGVTVLGSALIGLAPSIAVAAVGFVLVGLGKPAFDAPMQSWFGDRVPYAQRGRVLGLTELTWAGSLLVSVPLAGVLIERYGWRSQFVVVVVLGAAGLVTLRTLVASDRPGERVRRPLLWTTAQRIALAGVVAFSFAAENLFVVYGAWLEDDLGLAVAAIGVFTLLVVASELSGEGAVAAFGDRIGLRRAVLLGLGASGLAYLSLGLVGSSLPAAIAVVVVWFVGFEITIVATIPLLTELGGDARDRLMGWSIAAIGVGRALGALTGPALFGAGGIGAAGATSAAAAAIAAVLLSRRSRSA